MGLRINSDKSFLIYEYGDMEEITFIAGFLRVGLKRASDGFKYLGFNIKPCGYRNKDWMWLVDRFKSKINKWIHRWLSIGGRLIMIQVVLSQLFVLWCHLPTLYFDGACMEGEIGCEAWIKLSHREQIHIFWDGGT